MEQAWSHDLGGIDPLATVETRLRRLPFDALTLASGPSLVRAPIPAFVEERTGESVDYLSVAFSYVPDSTLPPRLRQPDIHLKDLSLFKPDGSMLWEAVRTSWRNPRVSRDVSAELVDHVRHVVRNRFRNALDAAAPQALERSSIRVDTDDYPALAYRSDLLYAIGGKVGDVVLTAVVPSSSIPETSLVFARLP